MAQLASRQRSASCEKREAQPACRTVRGHQHGRLTRSHPQKSLASYWYCPYCTRSARERRAAAIQFWCPTGKAFVATTSSVQA